MDLRGFGGLGLTVLVVKGLGIETVTFLPTFVVSLASLRTISIISVRERERERETH